MVDSITASCPSPVAAKQAQIITPTPLCYKHGAMHYGQTYPLWAHLWRTLLQKSCGLFTCNFAKCQGLFRQKRLSPGSPSKQVILFLSLIVLAYFSLPEVLKCELK